MFQEYVQGLQQGQSPEADRDWELVQAVECVAALSNAELVAQTVLFI